MSEKTKNKKMPEPVSQDPQESAMPPYPELTDEELKAAAGGTATPATVVTTVITVFNGDGSYEKPDPGPGRSGGINTRTPQ